MSAYSASGASEPAVAPRSTRRRRSATAEAPDDRPQWAADGPREHAADARVAEAPQAPVHRMGADPPDRLQLRAHRVALHDELAVQVHYRAHVGGEAATSARQRRSRAGG